jgi:hypothetical protein
VQRLLRRCPRAIRSNSEFYRTFPGAVAGVTAGDSCTVAAAGVTVGAVSAAGEVGSEWQNMLTGADVLPQQYRLPELYSAVARNGAPEEIRTPDPQIRSLILFNSLKFLSFP